MTSAPSDLVHPPPTRKERRRRGATRSGRVKLGRIVARPASDPRRPAASAIIAVLQPRTPFRRRSLSWTGRGLAGVLMSDLLGDAVRRRLVSPMCGPAADGGSPRAEHTTSHPSRKTPTAIGNTSSGSGSGSIPPSTGWSRCNVREGVEGAHPRLLSVADRQEFEPQTPLNKPVPAPASRAPRPPSNDHQRIAGSGRSDTPPTLHLGRCPTHP